MSEALLRGFYFGCTAVAALFGFALFSLALYGLIEFLFWLAGKHEQYYEDIEDRYDGNKRNRD